MRPKKPRPTMIAVSVKLHHDLQTRDEFAADDFLCGPPMLAINGVMERRYLEGAAEKEARAALVRVLRSERPIPQRIRAKLADLFDEGSDTERKLVHRFRHEGKVANRAAVNQVGHFLARQLRSRKLMKEAVSAAAEQFGLRERQIREYWRKFEGKEYPTRPRQ